MPIDLRLARAQHLALVGAVRSLGVDVLELPPDEVSVDSVFTQDLAVVVNGIALMCRPGPHRQAEVRTFFLPLPLRGTHPRGRGAELARYNEALAQLDRVFTGTISRRYWAGIEPRTPRTTVL